jgi:hypothetical protein
MAANADCAGAPSNTFTVVVNAVPSVTLSSATGSNNQTVNSGTAITPIVFTASNATTIYQGGSLPAGVNSSVTNNTILNIYGTPSATGTFGYTVTASNNGCPDATASGTITVNVPPPVTLCPQCCYDGSAWIDCYVTTNAYPFDNSDINTIVNWMGGNTTYYSGAGSNLDGRTNTAAITGATGGAVKICKDLGEGWYLPAYEELENMSAGAQSATPPLNGHAGANLLATPSAFYWSSTEYYDNGGRYSGTGNTGYQVGAVRVNFDGSLNNSYKTGDYYVRCAWRE